ncbi:MAG: hypothetical protein QOJ12_3479, partial [Thermoleophilales bacterium]|nr:hypothetical protein [Thermoleophilales bacterium]
MDGTDVVIGRAVFGIDCSARLRAGFFCVAVAASWLLLTTPVALGAAGDFSPAPTSPEATGAFPSSVATGDFNGDGKQDLATTRQFANNVTILLGNGAGDLSPIGTPASVGDAPVSIVVGDFNRDGRQDLATANSGSGTVTILLGVGTGGFNVHATKAAGTQPHSVAIGDFNGDGKQDLAAANSGSNNVTILLGDGTGEFNPTAGPETVGTSPQSVTVGDFNRDGKQDLAAANSGSNNVTILLGDGTGNFDPTAGPEAAGTQPFSVAVGDFNRDGKDDLATANLGSANVTILIGDGTGNFDPAAGSPEAAGTNPESVVVADFNGDAKPDLASVNGGSDDITIMLGDGTGGFTAAVTSPELVGDGPSAIAAGDFNGDGKPDLATPNFLAGNVTILLNQTPPRSNAESTAAPGSPETAGTSPQSLAVGDFNRDGKPDLATANSFSNNVTILLGDGTGGFRATTSSTGTTGHHPLSFAVG